VRIPRGRGFVRLAWRGMHSRTVKVRA
jgi:hypothetical protein